MSWLLILACLWALAATITALLPYTWQFPPGILLILTAPVLIFLVFYDHGWMYGLAVLLGVLSMIRRPLIYYVRRAMGLPTDLPPKVMKPFSPGDAHDAP